MTGSTNDVISVDRSSYLQVVSDLKDAGYNMCSDLCGVDYLEHMGRPLPEGVAPERFEIVVNLTSTINRIWLRIRVQIPESDPELDSLFNLYPGSEAMEREVYDLIGIRFVGHPDMTRILLPQDWEGHPLRKDYSIGRIPVQFKEVRRTR
ncbi:MAG: NADH-quinone oxidoreductase subunit C [Acidimicrobiaceae bacterium]|nr:NADH-quinone oxidoreductase subunit C [Acidimicrobiaceae bacterium]